MNVPSGQGILQIRDADRPQALGSPTRVSGTVDTETGLISGAALSTPPIEFETAAAGSTAYVTATFIQQGTGTGVVAATPPAAPSGQAQKGQVTLRASVIVDLVIKLGSKTNPSLTAHCVSEPVSLEMLSVGPYTEADGGLVVDPSFEVPPMPVNNAEMCIPQVTSEVDKLLARPGHSLSLFIQGNLPVPELKAETTTTLTADPTGGSLRGTDVTLTAEVAPVETNPLDPTGTVVFKDGTRTLGTAELAPDGTTTLTTKELRAGTRILTAEYQGDTEFAPSTSTAVSYSVAPAPIITGNFPEFVTRGAAPIEFDVTVDNGSARPVNGRVDVLFPGMNIGQMQLERQLPDTTWVPVTLEYVFTKGGASGTLGPEDGELVPAGGTRTHRLRVSALPLAQIRFASIEFGLVAVDAGVDGPKLVSSSWPFNIVTAARLATKTVVGVQDASLRPGQMLYVDATVSLPDVSPGTWPRAETGQVEFLLDGKVMPFRPYPVLGPLAPEQTRAPVDTNGYALGRVALPADLSAGPHIVTARYLGDASFLPSSSQQHVLPINDPLGPLYGCDFVTVINDRMGSYVEAHVRLPAHAEDGAELDLQGLDITMIPGGTDAPNTLSLLSTGVGGPGTGVDGIEIDLGEAGTITGDSVDYLPEYAGGDQFIHLRGLEGTIVVDGQPGEVMALPIERIEMVGTELLLGGRFTFTCTPNAESVVLGTIGVAGVSLAVETATDPVRVGDEVVLTATAAPALPTGLVEFFSGSTSLGTASGATGTATITVGDLPEGANSLTARYTGVTGSPYTSNVVQLAVQPAVECAAFAESGDGATVRLVYMELLGRCPDQAGFDYWTGRLAGGTSPEVFARSIVATPEAVGQVVDDAYRTMLGREADAPGRAFWVERMISRGGRYDQLLADLGASDEFWRLSGSTRSGFVTRVYQQLLNRAPDEPGLDYWVARLTPGASRRTLILSLANLDEPLGRLVGLSYDEILGRVPSGTERTDGIAVLRRTGDRSGFYAQLIGQPEFSTRAQDFPNPED